MGVPALFRWLSKKYPKIVERVIEDTPTKVAGNDGEEVIVPVNYSSPNPNGFEVDCLYLDMNGIVHPCTHPEGKPAPETEEEMMVEVFKYTERVVNMARPRKMLMMAIDGVAPRAKMNQQRSRRFRAAQEAAEKEEERKEAILLFAEMGHPVSDATANKKSWDSNAITPGTPFMTLLADSLRYWVSQKLNTDPGWAGLQVVISDASVPGEGEHKIMDWIRRERSHKEHDPNMSHVIYGLDADLIMLALATHEPHFKVLREDVFAQQSRDTGCRICGKTGHIAANCKGTRKIEEAKPDPSVVKPIEDKPFIFLDVGCLREYLTVELDLRVPTIPFDLERAIDDWVFLIFFVGNDFLPHLPSLEIREGAIDTLLRIWKREFERMGGWLTNHGKVEMARAEIILEGLAAEEDAIFQKRKEIEEKQDRNEKRRRMEEHRNQDSANAPSRGDHRINGTDFVPIPASSPGPPPIHHSLPSRPPVVMQPADAPGLQSQLPGMAPSASVTITQHRGIGRIAMSNAANEAASVPGIPGQVPGKEKVANKSAAEKMKAELRASMGLDAGDDEQETTTEDAVEAMPAGEAPVVDMEAEAAGKPEAAVDQEVSATDVIMEGTPDVDSAEVSEAEQPEGTIGESSDAPRGQKRKADEDEDDDDDGLEAPPNPDADQPVPKKKLKVNANGTVDYEDEVLLWEPGYRERYYRSKFHVELSDVEFRNGVVKSYLEGLSWVLHYYYQGPPSWQWFYPYHYAPFAADFVDLQQHEIKFTLGHPFKPFEQLMGVFPAASKIHLPKPFQLLMTEEDSPILDFYPGDFEIDMNGKKMAWQGIALLPFISQDRLLAALATKEGELTEDERRRNSWGDNVMLIAEENPLFDSFCALYTKNKPDQPMPIDHKLSRGILGSVLADPTHIPGMTLDSPLPVIPECPDIFDNRAMSVRYFFPRQKTPHRSILLNGAKLGRAILNEGDKEFVRSGGMRGGRGGGGGYGGPGGRGRGGYNSGTATPNGRGGGYNSGYSTPNNGSPGPSYGSPNNYAAPPPTSWNAGTQSAGRGGYLGGLPASSSSNGYGSHQASAGGYGGYGVGGNYAPAGNNAGGYGGMGGSSAGVGRSYAAAPASYSSLPTSYASRPPSYGPTPPAARPRAAPYHNPYAAPAASYGSSNQRGGYGGTGAGRGRGGRGGY